MTSQGDLFSVPRARRTDPETSHEAAGSVRNVTRVQAMILDILATWGPGTDQQIADIYEDIHRRDMPCSPSGVRTRRAELVALGRVRWTGETVRLASGRAARVWGLV